MKSPADFSGCPIQLSGCRQHILSHRALNGALLPLSSAVYKKREKGWGQRYAQSTDALQSKGKPTYSVQVHGRRLLNRVLVNEGMKTSYFRSGCRRCSCHDPVETLQLSTLSALQRVRTMAVRQMPIGSQKNLRKADSKKKRTHRTTPALTGRTYSLYKLLPFIKFFQPSSDFRLYKISLSLFQPKLLRGNERGWVLTEDAAVAVKNRIILNLSQKFRRKQRVLKNLFQVQHQFPNTASFPKSSLVATDQSVHPSNITLSFWIILFFKRSKIKGCSNRGIKS